ncbi:MARVEL domain-containing protein 2b [Oncorhynchus mykiss]|uniref:MARVEL domain containing 2b n=1 Tax=Oncorhynchus mykiss TaxID=8022 RepID=A0A8C7Q5F4_ONCMY|nr:MARVEL domain-containing protein 2b [Oncorhynchus mykiss]XP_036792324.1 MARVEL domain-containing protein 2b [Oncorhynchus mykiss]XP_036792325.1 MARVEL domain-containing protein 2b [Oncorhynchus mykiss]XP_036792326.1 MARVEL domain-containing protein 2b [Oncorhynchus mykiss]XP_036792327.1 MARVEL domain-containing protein 2b [Oncorhynchus mykiss]
MSARGGSSGRFNIVRDAEPHYDQVPVGSLWRDQDLPPPPRSLGGFRGADLAVSSDPLPPPPLPDQPPVGPDLYPPSDGASERLDNDSAAMDIKPVRRFIPDSFKNFFRGNSVRGSSNKPFSLPPSPPLTEKDDLKPGTTRGVPCSPPPSPSLPGSYLDPYGGSGGSYNSRKERDAMLLGTDAFESVSGVTFRSAKTYSERVEDYHQRYAYMKSWAGLLRILGCVELLLGAVVFACACAYVHKDNEWFNMFGYSQPQLFGGLGGGAAAYGGSGSFSYDGPKTPFILVVAGLAWIVTVIMLVLGMTMYYRTILLDSSWWPLTECVINLALGFLYMVAAVMYVRDTTRGGLCYIPVFNNGVNGAFCRTEAGQTAAIIFLFVNMMIYFVGAGVCLKLWRHEAARLRREGLAQEMKTIGSSLPISALGGSRTSAQTPLPTLQTIPEVLDGHVASPAAPLMMEPEILRGHIPAGHIPKPVIIADYVAKYPTIRTEEERDQYKAVFKDQYAEYKELHAEVQVMAKKFDEMDELMRNLPPRPSSQLEKERINTIVLEYQRKKADPTFLEKRERCEYLKNKLSHIKQKINEYNKVMDWNDGFN